MNFALMHPRDQIVMLMERIYGYGMTTTSGGNLSVLDDEGSIWITPAGVDKGTLKGEDVVRVRADGSIEGIHRPSSELPFHKAMYAARPDVRGVLHAHPAALGPRTPVVLVENDCVLTTGENLLQAYDRLEVAEFSAKALIASRALGDVAPISDAQVRELVQAFKLAE